MSIANRSLREISRTLLGALRVRTRARSIVHRFWPPEPRPLILMYHRIANEPIDPWRLAVSPVHFEEQLHVLRRTRYPLSLSDFVQRFSVGTLPQHAVAVTFDDGYFDNLEVGKPLLEAADFPATIFLATGYLDHSEQIWSDELARLILMGTASRPLEMVVQGKSIYLELSSKPRMREHGSIYGSRANKRRRSLMELWDILRHIKESERQLIIAQLRSTIDVRDYGVKEGRALTSDEVIELAKCGLITFGAHTVTHPVLPALSASDCCREIEQGIEDCETILGRKIESFAYPYGKFDDRSRAVVKAFGLKCACATREEPVLPTSDAFCLPRIHVTNINGDAFEHALRLASIAKSS